MWDLIYLGITVGFFGLMFLYVRACEGAPERGAGPMSALSLIGLILAGAVTAPAPTA